MRTDPSPRSLRLVALALAALPGAPGDAVSQQGPEPSPGPAIEERVEVDYVLIDFIVLDAEGRTVPDLALDELGLKVGGKKIPIETLDRDCAAGAVADPRRDPADSVTPPAQVAAERPPRIVLVFDYDHMDEHAEVFEHAQRLMSERASGTEQHMLVSLSEVLRIETPFTDDMDELRWALHRMRNDRDLFARNRSRLTEAEFFDRIHALFDLLERWPGRKTVVLFSGPFARDGFSYDDRYRELASLAAATRTAVYPVDTAGLRTVERSLASTTQRRRVDPHGTTFGGPPELRRLANETGGRMTSETNDIGVAYAQARRDMGCVYTLGFRDPDLDLDRNRNLSLKIAGRDGLRVVYPDAYVVRSEEERHASLFRTAAVAPHMFESAEIRGELFVTDAGSGSWKGLIGAEVRLEPGAVAGPGETWELRGFLRKPNGTIVHKFAREVALPEVVQGGPLSASTFDALDAPPGDYALSVVLADPRGAPRASTRPISLPALPEHGPFLLGPIPGRGSGASFEPLMPRRASEGESLVVLTVLCVAGLDKAGQRSSVTRWIADAAGREVRRFEDASFDLDGGEACREIVDALDTRGLAPGLYELRAGATAGEWIAEETAAELTIEARAPAADGP